MDLARKTFRHNKTGETVKVIDSFEDIVILENKQRISLKKLLDPNEYTEQIDASTFFDTQNAYQGLVDKIKSIPTENMIDESVSSQIGSDPTFKPAIEESAVIQTSEEDEIAELARKYSDQLDNRSDVEKQNKAFEKILNPNANSENEMDDTQKDVQRVDVQKVNAQRIDAQRIDTQRFDTQRLESQNVVNDPIITMFKNTKRNVDFSISIDIENKIPRLDFIEMLEDSYETSIIDFLSEEFTKEILKDPNIIKSQIKDKIKSLVYKEETKPVNKEKKLSAKDRVELVKNMENVSEINDFIKNEKAKTVLKVAKERIKEIERND